jgi:hypothetical protein
MGMQFFSNMLKTKNSRAVSVPQRKLDRVFYWDMQATLIRR